MNTETLKKGKGDNDQKSTGYHPELPSLNKAQDDYTAVTSDHVPFLATIPVSSATSSKDEEKQRKIKIVSLSSVCRETCMHSS